MKLCKIFIALFVIVSVFDVTLGAFSPSWFLPGGPLWQPIPQAVPLPSTSTAAAPTTSTAAVPTASTTVKPPVKP